MLARLQQFTTLTLLLIAATWLWAWSDKSIILASAGAALILMIHAPFLALEFLILLFVNRTDPAPQATVREIASAWWQEVILTPRIFCWRQPFFPYAEPDHLPPQALNRRGVILVHGLVCNRGFWIPWLKRLKAADVPFVAVNLEPILGPIEEYAPIIETAVQKLYAATGLAPVLVCHSMGGLASRAWLAVDKGNEGRVAHLITIGSPHQGTWLGKFSNTANGRQMRIGGDWLRQIAEGEPAERRALFTCWYSNCDNIVFPSSTATLAGADNRFIPAVAHVGMAFDPRVIDHAFHKIASL